MKHVLILRALGFVLIIALAVNITAVLAAPFYLGSSDPQTEAIASAKPPAKDSADADDDTTDTIDSAADANDDTEGITTTAFDMTDNTLIVIDGEFDIVQSDTPLESDSTEQSQSMSDRDSTVTLPTTDKSQQPSFTATVQSKSESVLFDLGVHIGGRSHHQTHPIANFASRFVRRSPSAVENTEDEDLLPAVVISDNPQPDHSENPVDVSVDVTEATNDTEQPGPSISKIVVENSSKYTVWFELNGTIQSLEPGALLIETTQQSVVRFDRGGSFGESRQELATGRYQFQVTREGWKLEMTKEDPASL